MSAFPEGTVLGQLRLIETYEFYDRPILFLSANNLDQLFLAVYADHREETEVWLYVPISQARSQQIRSGGVDLHSAFRRAESGYVHVIELSETTGEVQSCCSHLAEGLEDCLLPERGESLALATDTLPALAADLPTAAAQQVRHLIRLCLSLTDKLRSEAPANTVAKLLETVQGFLDAIGEYFFGAPKDSGRGRVATNIVQLTRLDVLGLGPGSFVIELGTAPEFQLPLLGQSLFSDIMVSAIELLEQHKNQEEVAAALRPLGQRVFGRYCDLLEAAQDNLETVSLEWASPHDRERGRRTTLTTLLAVPAARTVHFLRQETEETSEQLDIVGTLIGGDIEARTFRLKDARRIYSGSADEEAIEQLKGAKLGDVYSAKMRHIETVVLASGTRTHDYRLESLHPPDLPDSTQEKR